jgi:hypothetical protein
VPALRSCIAFFTLLCAFLPYLAMLGPPSSLTRECGALDSAHNRLERP